MNSVCAIGRCELRSSVVLKWHHVRILQNHELAKTAALASMQTNGLKGATTMKVMSLCV